MPEIAKHWRGRLLRLQLFFGASPWAICSLVSAVSLSACSIGGAPRERFYVRAVYHTVRSGESVRAISTKYKVPERQILLLSGLHDPVRLSDGQRLLVSQGGWRERDEDGRVVPALLKVPTSKPRTNGEPQFAEQTPGILGWPLATKARLSSRFGPRWGNKHEGIDLAAPIGTPILASHSGVVAYSGDGLSGYGNLVILRHSSGLTTVYAHNRRLLVEKGERVVRGQKIAELGMTGRTTGPHLHFEVRQKTGVKTFRPVDPLPYLLSPAVFKKYNGGEAPPTTMAKLDTP